MNPMYFFLAGSGLFALKSIFQEDAVGAIIATLFTFGCLGSLGIL